MITRLPESHLTLHAELLDQMIPASAASVMDGAMSGSFTSKKPKGNVYWYLQRSEGAKVRQIYLGPGSPSTSCGSLASDLPLSRQKPGRTVSRRSS